MAWTDEFVCASVNLSLCVRVRACICVRVCDLFIWANGVDYTADEVSQLHFNTV